jgi:hypothetical protein
MAVTLLTTIDAVQPAYNPYYLVLSGNNSSNTGFNYIVDLYSGSTYLRRLKVPPIPPKNNYGYCEISNICSDYISDNPMNMNWNAMAANTEMKGNFTIKLGEEYKYTWNFVDNFYCSNVSFLGKLGYTGSTTHTFAVGDYINVLQTDPHTTDLYDGVFRVVYVPDSYAVVVDYPHSVNTGVEGGVMSYQDNRKIVYSGLTTATTLMGSFAIGHEDYITYSATNYAYDSPTSNFLTELPENWPMRLTNNGYINILATSSQIIFLRCLINGIEFAIDDVSTGDADIIRIPAAPKTLNAAIGYNIFTANTITEYSIYLETALGAKLSEIFTFNLDTNCKPVDNVELLFEDLMGGMIPLNLRYITSTTTGIEREYYKKPLDYTLTNGKYIYDVNDSTTKQFGIKNKKVYTAISEYMTEEEGFFVEQLLLSKNVYFNTKNTEFVTTSATDLSEYVPVLITNSTFDRKTSLKDTLIQYTITFELSNNRPLNI